MQFIFILLAGSLVAGSIQVQNTEQPGPKPEKKICKAIVPTGSIFDKKVCLTRTEWRKFDEHNRNTTDTALQNRGSGMCDVGPQSCQNR